MMSLRWHCRHLLILAQTRLTIFFFNIYPYEVAFICMFILILGYFSTRNGSILQWCQLAIFILFPVQHVKIFFLVYGVRRLLVFIFTTPPCKEPLLHLCNLNHVSVFAVLHFYEFLWWHYLPLFIHLAVWNLIKWMFCNF